MLFCQALDAKLKDGTREVYICRAGTREKKPFQMESNVLLKKSLKFNCLDQCFHQFLN